MLKFLKRENIFKRLKLTLLNRPENWNLKKTLENAQISGRFRASKIQILKMHSTLNNRLVAAALRETSKS